MDLIKEDAWTAFPAKVKNSKKIILFKGLISGHLYFKHKRRCLLSMKEEQFSLKDLEAHLSQMKLKGDERPRVFHFFYEYGLLKSQGPEEIDTETPLVIELEYANYQVVKNLSSKVFGLPKLKLLNDLSLDQYGKKFDEVYKNLFKGNCYQVNLTYLFKYQFDDWKIDDQDLLQLLQKEGTGQYAHITSLKNLGLTIMSNSPECLFNIKGDYIYSMPIKGSKKSLENKKQDQWKALGRDKKEVGELNMITDLIRNDLTHFTESPSQVLSKRKLLYVPGIVHQYSLIRAKMIKQKSIKDALNALFPGGSITGAPKKKVMSIIAGLEHKRGIYCGSTLIMHKDLVSASINIRTCLIDKNKKEMHVGAGGGVTLLSNKKNELKELKLKLKSFINYLQSLGH